MAEDSKPYEFGHDLCSDLARMVLANAEVAKLNAEQAETIERLKAALRGMVHLATFGEQCHSCGKHIAIDGHREDCLAADAQRLLCGADAPASPVSR